MNPILLQSAVGSWLSGILSGFQQWATSQLSSWLIQSGWQNAIISLASVMPYLLIFVVGAIFALLAKDIIRIAVIGITALIVALFYMLQFGVLH